MPKKDEYFLTSSGFLKLEEELNELRNVKRLEVIEAIKEARALGDLSENADYDAARDEQAKVEARIKELERMIDNAVIIEENDNKDGFVSLGSTVLISYVEDDDEEEYKIVGSLEANPFENKISNESPIGKAILGKTIGDIVSVESPNGSYDVKILSVS